MLGQRLPGASYLPVLYTLTASCAVVVFLCLSIFSSINSEAIRLENVHAAMMYRLFLLLIYALASQGNLVIRPIYPSRCQVDRDDTTVRPSPQTLSQGPLTRIQPGREFQEADAFHIDESSAIPRNISALRFFRPFHASEGQDDNSDHVEKGSKRLGSSSKQNDVGSKQSEPVLSHPTNNTAGSIPGAMCGSGNSFAPCDDCCSTYGFCGLGLSFCGYGCQSGRCMDEDDLPILPSEPPQTRQIPGSFKLVGQSGVPAMAAGLMPNGKVVFIDKVENYTQLILESGQYAYSAEYDPSTNTPKALSYKTNAFCTGGAFLPDGRMISVGGNGPLLDIDPTVGDGFRGIRYLERHFDSNESDGADWDEPGHSLTTARWYASVQVLPNGTLFVASGSLNGLDPLDPENNNPTYELLDEDGMPMTSSIELPILEMNQPYYMYPFIHLLRDGNLFIFVARSAEIFDVSKGTTARKLPDLPGDYRTYPNTGGSVLLPLSSDNDWNPDILICGGGAYQDLDSPTDATCGRIQPFSSEPNWELERMPDGRGMLEGTLLPDDQPQGSRWAIAGSSKIPRMYHSVALLLLDGTVIIAGSNTVEQPILEPDPTDPAMAFATEFRVEIYTPPYLTGENIHRRPESVWLSHRYLAADSRRFVVSFTVREHAKSLKIALYHGGFITHSVHMGHRMIYLDFEGFIPGSTHQIVMVKMPPSTTIAPPGPYVIYVVVDGIPSVGQFVMVE
ncbi:Glyoxal oxidase [Rasamsonia emersonii CBS 393.64]|uniref:Glyoxal oxidase n=1 Tax=Rasamsonia emersonii (strain ATCC 16479 / CBS 393.64 / IMI 116815) TaxID=1408163 RepID=A0A0F4YYL5_RASE3|nr:Glyoxal oxidase [Rasamsonia emersonii CBS 393.64]KKA22936.1 Glyoxal oxidase [Rasamsonia emersonii CBS 393.64]